MLKELISKSSSIVNKGIWPSSFPRYFTITIFIYWMRLSGLIIFNIINLWNSFNDAQNSPGISKCFSIFELSHNVSVKYFFHSLSLLLTISLQSSLSDSTSSVRQSFFHTISLGMNCGFLFAIGDLIADVSPLSRKKETSLSLISSSSVSFRININKEKTILSLLRRDRHTAVYAVLRRLSERIFILFVMNSGVFAFIIALS